MDYLRLYNHHIPQSSSGYLTPFQLLKKWQKFHPHLFVKSAYNERKPGIAMILSLCVIVFFIFFPSKNGNTKQLNVSQLSKNFKQDKKCTDKIKIKNIQNLTTYSLFISQFINNPYYRALALLEVATHYAEMGQNEQADKILSILYVLSKKINDINMRNIILKKITIIYAQSNNFAKAFNILKLISNADIKYHTLIKITDEFTTLQCSGGVTLTKRIISILSKYLNATSNPYYKSLILTDMVNIEDYQTLKQKDEILNKAFNLTQTIDNHFLKAKALLKIANQYYDLDMRAAFLSLLSDALTLTKKMNLIDRLDILAQIAFGYASDGQIEASLDILNQALSLAKNIDDAYCKIENLIKLIDNYIEIDELACMMGREIENKAKWDCTKILVEALKIAQKIRNGDSRIVALLDIADNYLQIERKKVIHLLSRTIALARRIKNADIKLLSLVRIAIKYAELLPDTDINFINFELNYGYYN